jgi:high-affinity nickel permease
MIATTAAISLGLAVGARHAFEPDHLAAVSTLVGNARTSRSAVSLGLLWGLGHTLALLAVGIVLVALDGVLPERLGVMFELVVSSMLVLLGAR